jgi:SLT domain-containing protein
VRESMATAGKIHVYVRTNTLGVGAYLETGEQAIPEWALFQSDERTDRVPIFCSNKTKGSNTKRVQSSQQVDLPSTESFFLRFTYSQ